MAAVPAPVEFQKWIDEIKDTLKPPVANKLLYGSGMNKIMIVGGPNERSDYHIEEGEEFFYMIKGDMTLKILEAGVKKDVRIKEGECFLLPPRIPHSPQREADTVGLVVERERGSKEHDGLGWFQKESTDWLYLEFFHCSDLGTQLGPIIERFRKSKAAATGEVDPETPIPAYPFDLDTETKVDEPVSFEAWVKEHGAKGNQAMFGGDPKGEYTVMFMTDSDAEERCFEGEVFFYQHKGACALSLKLAGSDTYHEVTVGEGCVINLPDGTSYKEKRDAGSIGWVITNGHYVPPADRVPIEAQGKPVDTSGGGGGGSA